MIVPQFSSCNSWTWTGYSWWNLFYPLSFFTCPAQCLSDLAYTCLWLARMNQHVRSLPCTPQSIYTYQNRAARHCKLFVCLVAYEAYFIIHSPVFQLGLYKNVYKSHTEIVVYGKYCSVIYSIIYTILPWILYIPWQQYLQLRNSSVPGPLWEWQYSCLASPRSQACQHPVLWSLWVVCDLPQILSSCSHCVSCETPQDSVHSNWTHKLLWSVLMIIIRRISNGGLMTTMEGQL